MAGRLVRTSTWLSALVLTACSSTPTPKVLANHMVVSDHRGVALHPVEDLPLEDDCAEFQRLLSYAESVCEKRWRQAEDARPDDDSIERVDRILIHIHGGLNSLDKARKTAMKAQRRMDTSFRQSLKRCPQSAYENWHFPIFLAWPSGAIDSATEKILFIRQGHRWRLLGPLTMPFALAADLGEAVASAPINVPYTLLSDARQGLNVATGRPIAPSYQRAVDLYREANTRDYNVSLGTYRRGFWHQSKRFVTYWVTLPSKVLSQVIALEGIGRGAWEVMQRRASATVYAEDEFEGELATDADTHFQRRARGAFGAFFGCLLEWAKSNTGAKQELTFVAHSTGAIPFNHLLLHYDNEAGAPLPIRRVIYMAPACTTRDAVEALTPALRRRKGMTFHLVTLHPEADADEAQWKFLDLPPRGSLLSWIDNFFTNPTDHGDRVFGKWINAMQAIHLFEEFKDRVTIKAFAVDGSDVPSRHGDFNSKSFWEESFWSTD